MDPRLQDWFAQRQGQKDEAARRRQEEILLQEGLFEKVYAPPGEAGPEYDCTDWDENGKDRRYKRVPISVTPEEFQRICDLSGRSKPQQSEKGFQASLLRCLAYIIYGCGGLATLICLFSIGIFSGAMALLILLTGAGSTLFCGTVILALSYLCRR